MVLGTYSQMKIELFRFARITENVTSGSERLYPPYIVKEGVKRGKSTSFFHFRKRQELSHEKSGK